ncbi:hypothetical protein FOZ63_013038 [Perkinsus olseni]|uniref:Uncharacterized protein n=1 Tax=Perkinsus olseni TaxID=32597 RepID=A0A7J6T911_PEROL|nr:hypothetical protein FOZ63_013038 [Perkinsus olseni]
MSFDPARMVKDFERTAGDVAAVKQKLGGMLDKLKVMKVSAEKAAKEKPFVTASKKHLLQLRESAAEKLEELADAAKIAEQNGSERARRRHVAYCSLVEAWRGL